MPFPSQFQTPPSPNSGRRWIEVSYLIPKICGLRCFKIKHWLGSSLRILFKFVDRSWTYSVLIKRALGWVQHTKDYMRTTYCERPFAFISMLSRCTGCVSIDWLDWGFSTTCLCTLSMLQTVPANEWLTGHLAFQYSTSLREAVVGSVCGLEVCWESGLTTKHGQRFHQGASSLQAFSLSLCCAVLGTDFQSWSVFKPQESGSETKGQFWIVLVPSQVTSS